MKHLVLFVATLVISVSAIAQRTIKLHNLWEKPQVHILFGGYRLSFKISDIDKSLVLLSETGNNTFGRSSGLDEEKHYYMEILPGLDMQYHDSLEILMQNVVGPFLLLSGRAEVKRAKRGRRNVLSEIIADLRPVRLDDSVAYINFFDPKTKKLMFSGCMSVDMYNQDLGLE